MAHHHPHLTDEQEECLRGCSQQGQYDDYRERFERGLCSFCQIDHTRNTVLYEGLLWLGWEVPPRYTTRQRTLALQLVFFPREHLGYHALTREHFAEEFDIRNWVIERYPRWDGGVIGKVGDMRWNVGSIPGHYHLNWYVPNRQGEVAIYLAKDEVRITRDTEQMLRFKANYEQERATT